MTSIPDTDVIAPEIASFAPRYTLQDGGRTTVEHFDAAPPFSSMLPGIGGMNGVPLWCFYVNRGQAVVSFGVRGKDGAIAEFLPATWAYQLVGLQGFRTFCRIDGSFYEPFSNRQCVDRKKCVRTMYFEPSALGLTEVNQDLGLRIDVQYFSPVDQPVGSLIRTLTISDLSGRARDVTVLDGLPVVIPAGCSDHSLKHTRRLAEAYACAERLGENVCLFRTKVRAHDEAEVQHVCDANFFASWCVVADRMRPLDPLVDPNAVFGEGQDFQVPRVFWACDDLSRLEQQWENRLPCAFAPSRQQLAGYESLQVISVFGSGISDDLIARFCGSFAQASDVLGARRRVRDTLGTITDPALTVSRHRNLDAYCRQNLLDNVIRGGVPVQLHAREGVTPVHVYARLHGDLERDYNDFDLPAVPMSTGSGNFRDICQNRRNDFWLYPDVGDEDLRMFATLLMPDGYNPLNVSGYRWIARPDAELILPEFNDGARERLKEIVRRPFQAGEVLQWLLAYCDGVAYRTRWLDRILQQCDRVLVASGHHGGFWTDHWTYITDLLDAHARLHPTRIHAVLTEQENVGWFDDGALVASRAEKYVNRPCGIQQVNAVRDVGPRASAMPAVTMFGKLSALVAIKAVSFDVECRGIEMEAGRPGWNDALNGLPAQFGSSTCETAELARLARWLLDHGRPIPDTKFPEVVANLIEQVVEDLEARTYDWDRSATLREQYRESVQASSSEALRTIPSGVLVRLLEGTCQRSHAALERSIDSKSGLMQTYFVRRPTNRVPDGTAASESPVALVRNHYESVPLPLYLEGQVHWLRVLDDSKKAREVWESVRSSPLFDESLEMYKLNESLAACPEDIGRARTFTAGWFENESIWLHMSYKYLVELLRHGLYDEFFADAKTMLVPFMDSGTYGRTILENSSFIVSSAHPDPALRGRGFVGRLSGTTCEFVDIWLRLTLGSSPFSGQGGFGLRLSPILPGDWFTTEELEVNWGGREETIPADSFACALLGATLLVYHNPRRRDTYGSAGVGPTVYDLDRRVQWKGDLLPDDLAQQVRDRRFRRIDVRLD